MTPFEEMCDGIKRSIPGAEFITIAYRNFMGSAIVNIPKAHFISESGRPPTKVIPSLRHSLGAFVRHSLNSCFPDWARSPTTQDFNALIQQAAGAEDDDEEGSGPVSNLITKGKIFIDLYSEVATITHLDCLGTFANSMVKDIKVDDWPGP